VRSTSRKRPSATVALAMLAALTVAGSTLASAATVLKKRNCSLSVALLIGTVNVNSGAPPASGSVTQAATVDGRLCGKPFHGAARDVNSSRRWASSPCRESSWGRRAHSSSR
jgi:hypothetical protein